MMVGYWELEPETIFESFVTGKAMELKDPDQVDGPGCIECGKHWMSARHTPCEAQTERPHDDSPLLIERMEEGDG